MALTALLPSPALAGQDELALAAGPVAGASVLGGKSLRGYGLGADLRYGFDDAWTAVLGGQLALHPEDEDQPGFSMAWATAGVVYAVDVFVLVPYFRLDAARYLARPDGEGYSDWGVHGSVGVDWRRWPGWALGTELRFHGFSEVLPQWPSYVSVWVNGSWICDGGLFR